MEKIIHFICLLSLSISLSAQESPGNFIADKKTGCTVWYKHTFAEDSIIWSGGCKNKLAEGEGVLVGFTKGKETSRYTGNMMKGKPHGQGVFVFGNRKLQGNFFEGELLDLDGKLLSRLYRHVVSENDSTDMYVGDNNNKQLYYHALVPEGNVKGALVLMPGTWETTEHLLSSTKALCEMAYKNQLVVLALSVNQRLALTDQVIALMNTMLSDATKRYAIPKDKIAMGGWSMGGLFSLRYTELANEFPNKTAIKPAAVFSVDGPCDLENIYTMFQRKLKKNPEANEPLYGIRELEKYCGGSPDKARDRYEYYSCYSNAKSNGGNAAYLKNTPTRIYCDVDPVWWMQNRGVDMYDMNALDQTAMIMMLQQMGNPKAEFINAFGKGYRIEGNRHPHSWSILDAEEILEWIFKCWVF